VPGHMSAIVLQPLDSVNKEQNLPQSVHGTSFTTPFLRARPFANLFLDTVGVHTLAVDVGVVVASTLFLDLVAVAVIV
jgi:hypothetical protein